ncbi:MAG TPA: hypothetical protein VGV41_10200 [Pseudolabrys sp.]|uniref:hypothetical protein n=1 Tax=Pseudolabrys sp. TaxID=1960880 RepID=UPI002DDD8805|nr:hypothetical protein [Pseudolabrys sp.]HEV2629002.1 hypothetical protein [Pseudolabrys sp.]
MTPAEQYRVLASRLRAKARLAETPRLTSEWEHLARCYLRLARQAEENEKLDLVYETPPRREGDAPA